MPRRPYRELDEFTAYLNERNFLPKTVIDVGACYGTIELLQGFADAYHILIEPLPAMEKYMKNILEKHRGEYHQLAVGEKQTTMELFVPKNGMEGATLVQSQGLDKISCKVNTLDHMFGDRHLEGPILLKTDCQGYDLNVMKGGEEFLKRVSVIVMEVNMFHPRGLVEFPDFGEIVCWMREHNFVVYDIISYQTRPLDNALGYVDLIFVPNDGPLREHHRWQ